MPERPIPTRKTVDPDTYALVIHEGGQDLYRYEKPTPWEDPEWIERQRYDHGEVPPLNLEETQVEQRTDGTSLQAVILYATELDADSSPADATASSTTVDEGPPYRGYVIRFSDGTLIPGSDRPVHTEQKQNMGAAVDYLVREYDLIDKLELPYLPELARQNCTINTEPAHPNGDEMRSPYELTGGYYLHTSLNKRGKRTRLDDLADHVGLTVEFLGEW